MFNEILEFVLVGVCRPRNVRNKYKTTRCKMETKNKVQPKRFVNVKVVVARPQTGAATDDGGEYMYTKARFFYELYSIIYKNKNMYNII